MPVARFLVFSWIGLLIMGCASSGGPTIAVAVFPGAEGFGTETSAGRGGRVIKVTNLNDSGEGSLRAACQKHGARIVVFETSGTIALKSDITISSPYLTISGQTAPSPGITLKGAGLLITSHDILVQHIRIRVGDDDVGPWPGNRDGLQILHRQAYRVVADHLSVSWAVDENGSTWGAHDITVSNSIFSEALRNAIHPEGFHSMGFLVGDRTRKLSIIGNLLAHNDERQPLIKAGSSVLCLNNLVYNPGGGGYVGVGIDGEKIKEPAYLSAVGNVFYAGPNTRKYSDGSRVAYVASEKSAAGTKVYLEDIYHPNGDVWRGPDGMRVSIQPIDTWPSPLTVKKSEEVLPWVLLNAGARPADRDPVDERIIREVRERKGMIVDSPEQVGGWPSLPKNYRPFKIPDSPNGDDDGDGYSNIEEVLHQMAAEVEGRSLP